MKEKNKRRLAKEILYFFFTSLCIILIWIFLEAKNYLAYNKIRKLNTTVSIIISQIDSLDKIVLFDNYHKNKNDSNLNELVSKGASQNQIREYLHLFKKRFGNKEILEKEEELNKNKISAEHDLEITEDNLLYNYDKKNILIWCIAIFFGLVYPIRFIYYSIVWSFRTLKKSNSA